MTLPARVLTIIENVAATYEVTPDQILGQSRMAHIAVARRHAMICCRNLTMATGRPPSFPQIGSWFNRDHTTVIHACRNMQAEEQGALAL